MHRTAPVVAALLALGCLSALPAATAGAAGVPMCGGLPATMVLGDGDDAVSGTEGDDVVVLGGGDDSFVDPGGDDTVCAGAGDDYVDTGAGDDRAYGGSGTTAFRDGPGHDVYDGEQSHASVALDGDGVVLHAAEGHERGNDDDELVRIFYVVGTAGDDVYVGTDGSDMFLSDAGRDVVRLGGGKDLTVVRGAGSRVFGGGAPDTITIGRAAYVDAGPGDDLVTAERSGAGTVLLGRGYDVFESVDGTADVSGGSQGDSLWFLDSHHAVSVDLAAGTARFRGGKGFRVRGFEGVQGTGHNDVLRGTRGDDQLDGMGGDDTLHGLAGDDVLGSHDGHDTAYGGPGFDICLSAARAFSCATQYGEPG